MMPQGEGGRSSYVRVELGSNDTVGTPVRFTKTEAWHKNQGLAMNRSGYRYLPVEQVWEDRAKKDLQERTAGV
jgi:hypothetical protein